MSLIFWPEDVHGSDQFGVKGQELLALSRAGISVPEWFLLPAECFYTSLVDQEYELLLRSANATNPPELNFSFQLDYDLNKEIQAALDRVCPQGERVAVRYSPNLEAGALPPRGSESHLFVAVEEVARAVRAVWKAHFSQPSMKARMAAGFPPVPKAPAIVIQRMLDPESSGVCFSANPVTGARGEALVHAVCGLPTVLVSHDAPRDAFHVSDEGRVTTRHVVEKHSRHACHHDSLYGVVQIDIPEEEAGKPAITDQQAADLAGLVRRIALQTGRPQRIDWAIEKGNMYVLAAGDIAELQGLPDPEALENLWDFAPMAGIVPGAVHALAGSLCRRLVVEGWCEALRSAGMHNRTLVRMRPALHHAVGWIEGRLCLNRSALARSLSGVPVPKPARQALAALFGCSLEQLDDAKTREDSPRNFSSNALAALRNAAAVKNLCRPRRRIVRDFLSRSEALAAQLAEGVKTRKPEDVLARLEASRTPSAEVFALHSRATMQVILQWAILRRLTRSKCGDNDGALARSLVVPQHPLACEEVLRRLATLATGAARHKRLSDALRAGRLREADSVLSSTGELAEHHAWLRDHLPNALAWTESGRLDAAAGIQEFLLEVLACGASVDFNLESPNAESQAARLAKLALEKMDALLKDDPKSGKLVREAIRRMHQSLADFAAMRAGFCMVLNAYGMAHLRLGQCLHEADAIEKPSDIAWLTEEEVVAHLNACAPDTNLAERIRCRREDHKEESNPADSPALLFTARGCLHLARQVPRRRRGDLRHGAAKCAGIGCGIGTVRARVRLADSPGSLTLRSGEILALPVADIRFRFHLHALAGLLVEHGSAADELIVLALRLGKPVILGPTGVLLWLQDGEPVEIQAGSGTIRKTGSTLGVFS